MTNIDYNTLQCRIKALQGQVDSFKSGKEYQKLRAQHAKDVAYYHGEIGKLQKKLEASHQETFRVRNIWFKIFDDLQKEYEKKEELAERKLRKMESRALKAEKERDDLKDKLTELRREYYAKASSLEDEQGKNRKLLAQLNHDFENSSISSSKTRKQKRSRTAGKRPDVSLEGSRGTKDTEGKSRLQPAQRFFRHRRKSRTTLPSRRPGGLYPNSR